MSNALPVVSVATSHQIALATETETLSLFLLAVVVPTTPQEVKTVIPEFLRLLMLTTNLRRQLAMQHNLLLRGQKIR